MTDKAQKIIAALRTACGETCDDCPADEWCHGNGTRSLEDDAADLIESISVELEQVKRERDAAVADINMCCPCDVCTRSCTSYKVNPYDECAEFEWRGVSADA